MNRLNHSFDQSPQDSVILETLTDAARAAPLISSESLSPNELVVKTHPHTLFWGSLPLGKQPAIYISPEAWSQARFLELSLLHLKDPLIETSLPSTIPPFNQLLLQMLAD